MNTIVRCIEGKKERVRKTVKDAPITHHLLSGGGKGEGEKPLFTRASPPLNLPAPGHLGHFPFYVWPLKMQWTH